MNRPNFYSRIAGAVLFVALSVPSFCASIHTLSVNTSSISGTTGFLDFAFAPGDDPLTVEISLFSPAANLGAVDGSSFGYAGNLTTGNSLILGIGAADYFRAFTFGNFIQFTVKLSGTALDNPSPSATTGNSFSFAMFNSTGFEPVLTSNLASGELFTMDVAPRTGAYSLTSFAFPVGILSETPEPMTLLLSGAGLAALCLLRKRIS